MPASSRARRSAPTAPSSSPDAKPFLPELAAAGSGRNATRCHAGWRPALKDIFGYPMPGLGRSAGRNHCRMCLSPDVGLRSASHCGALCLKAHGRLLPSPATCEQLVSNATRSAKSRKLHRSVSDRGRPRGGCPARLPCWRGSGVQSLTCCSGSDWPGRTDLCLQAGIPPLAAAAVSTHPLSPAEGPDAGLCVVDESLP